MLSTSNQGRFGNKMGSFCQAEQTSKEETHHKPKSWGRCRLVNEKREASAKIIFTFAFPLPAASKQQTLNQSLGFCFVVIDAIFSKVIMNTRVISDV